MAAMIATRGGVLQRHGGGDQIQKKADDKSMALECPVSLNRIYLCAPEEGAEAGIW